MRKITFLKSLLLLCALMAGVGSAWAEEETSTLTFGKACGGSGTADDKVVWTISSDQNESTFDNTKGIHYGTSNAAVSYLTLTTSGISGTITKIVVNASGAKNTSAKLNVKVGDSAFGSEQSLTNTATDYTLKGSASGAIEVKLSQESTKKGLYVKSVAVTYESSSVATTTIIDASGITNNDIYTSTVAGSFSATVKAGDNTINGAIVTWKSSKEDVATIASDGAVTLVSAGTTTITASYAGVENEYKASSDTYELIVVNSNANDGSQEKPFTVAEAIENTPASGTSNSYYIKGIVSAFFKTDIVSDDENYRYYISDDGTKTNQLLVFKGKGLKNEAFSKPDDLLIGDEVTIYGGLTTFNSTKEIATGNYIVSRKTKEDPALTVDDVEMYVEQEKALTDLYLVEDDYAGIVSFSSSDDAVATIADNKLRAVAVGTAVITVTATADAKYKAAEETFTVTVKTKDVAPEGATASRFVKVTKTADITDGEYLIVYGGDASHASVAFNGGLTEFDAAKNGIAVTIAEGVITADATTTAASFTWNSSAKTLTSKSGYVIGQNSYGNGLKASKTDTYTNTIVIDDNENVVISAVESASSSNYTTLRYNYASDNLRFRYYKSGQQAIQLYKLQEASSFDIEMGAAGWRTLVSAKDVTLPEGLTAYVVTANDGGSATLATAGSVKANTPYILKGDEGTYTLTMALGVTAPASNLLKISDKSTGNGVYVLYNGTQGVGFYKWYGGSLGAGRVYLPATAGAPEFIALGGETTGIDTVKGSSIKVQDSEIYNLAGQRVARPTKGLYIVNGKKVVIR